MIILGMAALGILLGIRAAKAREGQRLDMAQWGAVYGIGFALLGFIITIALDRTVI